MKIEHLTIWVSDVGVMRSFYENYFNANSGALYRNSKKNFPHTF